MKSKILFLDLDGTIREPKTGKWVSPWDNQKPMDGAIDAVKIYCDRNYRIFGITNQGGVGAGHKTLSDCIKEQKLTIELFPELSGIFFCPDFEGNICYKLSDPNREPLEFFRSDNKSSFRKPGYGMLELAANLSGFSLKFDECWMVGDRDENEQCAADTGINFCPAQIWRDWFNPGVDCRPPTPELFRFLEAYGG